jgi:hypothetical protein
VFPAQDRSNDTEKSVVFLYGTVIFIYFAASDSRKDTVINLSTYTIALALPGKVIVLIGICTS